MSNPQRKAPKDPSGGEIDLKAHNTHESHTSQYPHSALLVPLEKTNKQMRAPLGEWWITLTASYIIFVRLPNITSTDKSVGTKFCLLWGQGKYFLCVKNLHSLDLLLHNDWSEQHFHMRRWTEAHLREFTCAYLSSPAGDSCSASVHAAFRDEGSWGNQRGSFNWQSCFFSNNDVKQFWAIALAKKK